MKKYMLFWLTLISLLAFLGACVPYSFSPPTIIRIGPTYPVEQAAIAVDADGRSHIVGVSKDRIMYYRTRFGEPLYKMTFTMTSNDVGWIQYNPDIAVLDNGTAYLVWIEQRGGSEKYACYRDIPLIPPIGGYKAYCARLDTELSTGIVWVTARGNTAYAVYDRIYDGRTADLWYKQLTKLPPNSGRVDWFTERLETARIYSLDMGIDSGGFLHVGYHYNYTITGVPPFNERLEIRSNRSAAIDGTMEQVWVIFSGNAKDQDVPVSLSFYYEGSTERVALANVEHPTTVDRIYIDSCAVNGCEPITHKNNPVSLPFSWFDFSIIDDVEILGIDDTLYLSFIGDDDTTYNEQVYYKDAFSASDPTDCSNGSATWKLDLEMTRVDPRPESPFYTPFPTMAWAESDLATTKFYTHEGITRTLVYNTTCGTSLPAGDIASNGFYFSGVWDACLNTWFSSQAWLNNMPLILR
jgi:hypothetical protein